MPVAYADGPISLGPLHDSFKPIYLDNTRGALLLQKLLSNVISKEQLGIPLFLSPNGVTAAQQLITMINLLPDSSTSKFMANSQLYDYLSASVTYDLTYNLNVDLTKLSPIISYELPVKSSQVLNGTDAGVYAFVHKPTGHVGLGSATTFTSRLEAHLRSFNGKRETNYLHNWVSANGGLDSIT